ncbi:unnamed protein product [Prunus armeniaca]
MWNVTIPAPATPAPTRKGAVAPPCAYVGPPLLGTDLGFQNGVGFIYLTYKPTKKIENDDTSEFR